MDTQKYATRMRHSQRAAHYANRFEQGSRKRINQREQRAVRTIFNTLPDCRSVVDVPSGAGRFLGILSENSRQVIAVDVALEILRFARQITPGRHFLYLQGDASRLPLKNSVADGIFCNRLLHHIKSRQEREVFLKEFNRVCRRYVVLSFFDYHTFGALRRFLKRLKGRVPSYERQPTLKGFTGEAEGVGFRVRAVVETGAVWVTQKYLVLEKL